MKETEAENSNSSESEDGGSGLENESNETVHLVQLQPHQGDNAGERLNEF